MSWRIVVIHFCLLVSMVFPPSVGWSQGPEPKADFKPAPKPLSVLFIGDSLVEEGTVTGSFAKEIESRYGFYGSGYRSLLAQSGNGRAGTYPSYVTIKNDEGWTLCRGGPKGAGDARGTPDGNCIRGDKAESVTEVDFFGERIDVYYRTDQKFGSFAATLDSDDPKKFDTKSSSALHKETLVAKGRGWHHLKLTVIEPPVVLLGIDVQCGPVNAPRVVVHKWGNGALSSADTIYLNESAVVQTMKSLSPNVVVVMLGSQDSRVARNSFWIYEANLVGIVKRIRLAAPKARVIVVSPIPTDESPAAEMYRSYIRTLPILMHNEGIEYFDLGTWIGSPEKAIDEGWSVFDDTSNLTSIGGGRVAGRLLDMILGTGVQTPPPSALAPETLTDRGSVDVNVPEVKQVFAWLAADGVMSVDESGRVAHWENPINSAFADQVVPEWRPTITENAINGHAAMHFDGRSNFMLFHGMGGSTLWAPCRMVTIVFRERSPFGSILGDGHTGSQIFGPGKPGSKKFFEFRHGKLPSGVWVNGKWIKPDEVEIGTGTFRIMTIDPGSGAGVTAIGLNQYCDLQNKVGFEMLTYLDGDIAELVIYNYSGIEVEDARKAVEKYLSEKYAIPITE